MGERHRVQDVLRLGRGALVVLVDQHDLAGRAAQHERVGGGAADHAGADDADLHGCSNPVSTATALTPIAWIA